MPNKLKHVELATLKKIVKQEGYFDQGEKPATCQALMNLGAVCRAWYSDVVTLQSKPSWVVTRYGVRVLAAGGELRPEFKELSLMNLEDGAYVRAHYPNGFSNLRPVHWRGGYLQFSDNLCTRDVKPAFDPDTGNCLNGGLFPGSRIEVVLPEEIQAERNRERDLQDRLTAHAVIEDALSDRDGERVGGAPIWNLSTEALQRIAQEIKNGQPSTDVPA